MIGNHNTDAMLVRYADGLANEAEQQEIEALVRTDAAAQELLQQLIDTQLPYKEAFDRHLPAPAESLPVTDSPLLVAGETGSGRFGGMAVAATLVFGLLLGAVVGRVAPFGEKEPDLTVADAPANPPEWVRLVADYHSLYVRETLTAAAVEAADTTSNKVSRLLSRTVQVPALDEFGLQFRRSQMLAVGDSPLVQLTYLPETDKPVAVCILKRTQAENLALVLGKHATMSFAHWQNGQHAVVIVGELTLEQIQALATRVRQELFVS